MFLYLEGYPATGTWHAGGVAPTCSCFDRRKSEKTSAECRGGVSAVRARKLKRPRKSVPDSLDRGARSVPSICAIFKITNTSCAVKRPKYG